MKIEKYRKRVHCLLLYPDDATHVSALLQIEHSYDYALILHDRDVWTEEDELKNPEHKKGENKKPHYHVILRFPNSVWNTAIAKNLGIGLNYIEPCNNFENALQYLIHYNDADKAQYQIDEVKGSLKTRLLESINKVEKSEGEKVAELINIIKNWEDTISITDFSEFCAINGYWSEFRRSGAIFCKIIDEHNMRFYDSLEKEDNNKEPH